MTYGFGAWGLDFWGTDPNLLLEGAVAVNTHAVLVTCSRPLRITSSIATGDALNPGTWVASYSSDGAPMTPSFVEKVSERQVVITFREALRSWNNYHTIGSTTLQADNNVLVSAPYSLLYRGVLPTTAVNEPTGPFDLLTTDIVGGSLKTNENGGYVRVYGVDLIRKMIFRRLTTMPGAYFYMSQEEFGVGLKIKGLLRSSSLLQLQREIKDEILQEPGTVDAKVALTLGSGVLSIFARVQTDQGVVETTVTASS